MAINMSKHKMTPARCQSSHYYVSTSPTLIYGPGWAAGIFWRDQSTSLLPPSPLPPPPPPPPLLLTSSSKFIPCPTSSHQTTHSPPAQPGRPAAAKGRLRAGSRERRRRGTRFREAMSRSRKTLVVRYGVWCAEDQDATADACGA